MELCKFPSIEQFRHAIKSVERHYTFAGLDKNGKPIYDSKKPLPTLSFRGTVKLHGTNGAIGYCDEADEIWAQSRTTILRESQTDQFGFYNWSQQKKAGLKTLCQSIPHEKDQKVYIFGEWCGGSVQKGVALQELPKMFVVFAILLTKKPGLNPHRPLQHKIQICSAFDNHARLKHVDRQRRPPPPPPPPPHRRRSSI